MMGGTPGGTTTNTTPPPGTTTTRTTVGTGTGTTGGTGGMFMNANFLCAAASAGLRPGGQQWFETFGTDPLSGVVAVHRDLPGGLSLNYSSDTAVIRSIVASDMTWTCSNLPSGPLTATLKISGVTHSSVTIDHTGIQQGSPPTSGNSRADLRYADRQRWKDSLCASHWHAGDDARTNNTLNPGAPGSTFGHQTDEVRHWRPTHGPISQVSV